MDEKDIQIERLKTLVSQEQQTVSRLTTQLAAAKRQISQQDIELNRYRVVGNSLKALLA